VTLQIYTNPRQQYHGDLADYPLENYPDYEPGMPPRFHKLAAISHLEEYERVWGRKWGEQGVGRLRDVALTRPTDYEFNPLFAKDPVFFMYRHRFGPGSKLTWQDMLDQHDDYAKLLKENGVNVHYMEFEDTWGAYGPLRKLYVAGRLGTVIRGGVIIKRWGHGSWGRGLERHAMKYFVGMNCPILLYPTGRAILEGTWAFPAENIAIIHMGIAMNKEGLEQVMPVLRAAGIEQVITAQTTSVLDSFSSGIHFHTDHILTIAGLGVALVDPSQLDWDLCNWFRENRIRMIEVPPDELASAIATNGMSLDTNKIIMPTGAKKTNALLRKEGVEVIEFETSKLQALMQMGSLRCMTCRLYREPGPRLEEIKR
jgi:N-dimethylarginine dimethylaminohydrolase